MPDAIEVRGRGELQLAVLIENMRREGFELSVSPPAVLFKTDEATKEQLEPYENVVIDVDEAYSGLVSGNGRFCVQCSVAAARNARSRHAPQSHPHPPRCRSSSASRSARAR